MIVWLSKKSISRSIVDTVSKAPLKTPFLNVKTDQTSPFWGFAENPENMRHVIFNKESKTGLEFEIEHLQQKCWLLPNV